MTSSETLFSFNISTEKYKKQFLVKSHQFISYTLYDIFTRSSISHTCIAIAPALLCFALHDIKRAWTGDREFILFFYLPSSLFRVLYIYFLSTPEPLLCQFIKSPELLHVHASTKTLTLHSLTCLLTCGARSLIIFGCARTCPRSSASPCAPWARWLALLSSRDQVA